MSAAKLKVAARFMNPLISKDMVYQNINFVTGKILRLNLHCIVLHVEKNLTKVF